MAAPPAAPPAPGAAAPGGPAAPQEMDELQMELLIQQAMFDLLQKPIIPDMLVFVCSCLYLCTMLTTLVAGAVYFTYRLKPALPPPPPEETESTALITDLATTTTEAPKLWPKRARLNPLICVLGIQAQAINATRSLYDYLRENDVCNVYTLKEAFDSDAGDLVLAGKRGNDEVKKLVHEQYGDTGLEKLAPAVLCCSVKADDLNFVFTSASLYLKLRTGEDMNNVETYLVDNKPTINYLYLEIGETDLQNLTEAVIGMADMIIVRSSSVTSDALAGLNTAPLANSLLDMLRVVEDAVLNGVNPTRQCAMFTVSALQATKTAGGIDSFGETVDSVTAIKQSKVCHLTDHITKHNNGATGVSLFRPAVGGLPYYTFDTNETIGVKVEAILRSNWSTCIVAYDVQNDDCPYLGLTLTIQKAFDKKLHY